MTRHIRAAGFCAVTALIALFALLSPPSLAAANGALEGSYVFVEQGTTPNGQPAIGLALLRFAGNGTVVGTKMTRAAMGAVVRRDVQGVWTRDGSHGVLTLTGGYTDSEENNVAVSESYKLVFGENSEVKAVRTCLGYFSVARIVPAAATAVQGAWSFAESVVGQAFARVVELTFDAAGNADGQEIIASPLLNGAVAVKASASALPEGFGSLTITANLSTEEEAKAIVENYLFLTAGSGVWAMRIDSGICTIVNLTR